QTKVGEQIESLVKSVFLLSGIALTMSIGLFKNPSTLHLSSAVKCLLKVSWGSFFASIVLLVISLSMIVVENYRFGTRWFHVLKTNTPESIENVNSRSFVRAIEILLFLGVLLFILGMFGLASTSISILGEP
ncbi:MAG: hypothetical protein WCA32_13365, partial [Chromatiaceae bacterium]